MNPLQSFGSKFDTGLTWPMSHEQSIMYRRNTGSYWRDTPYSRSLMHSHSIGRASFNPLFLPTDRLLAYVAVVHALGIGL